METIRDVGLTHTKRKSMMGSGAIFFIVSTNDGGAAVNNQSGLVPGLTICHGGGPLAEIRFR